MNSRSINSELYTSLYNFVLSELIRDPQDVKLEPDTKLLQSGLVDSLNLFMVTNFIEDNYAITIENDEITMEHFETLQAMESFVLRKKDSQLR